MSHALVLSSILLALPAQEGGRAPSMLGGQPARKSETARIPASKPDVTARSPVPKAGATAVAPARAATVKPATEEGQAQALAKYNEMKEKTPGLSPGSRN